LSNCHTERVWDCVAVSGPGSVPNAGGGKGGIWSNPVHVGSLPTGPSSPAPGRQACHHELGGESGRSRPILWQRGLSSPAVRQPGLSSPVRWAVVRGVFRRSGPRPGPCRSQRAEHLCAKVPGDAAVIQPRCRHDHDTALIARDSSMQPWRPESVAMAPAWFPWLKPRPDFKAKQIHRTGSLEPVPSLGPVPRPFGTIRRVKTCQVALSLHRYWGPSQIAALHNACAATIWLAIEFRPNDLALPRLTRLTDDLPKSRD
jgi:hypothetical protein